jgi:hypothetical protein
MRKTRLVFGFVVIGCDNDTTNDTTTEFEGTWTRTSDSATLVFADNNVNVASGVYVGTFTFTATEITFSRDGNVIIFDYTLSGGNTLVLHGSSKNTGGALTGASQIEGTFTK